MSDKQPKRGDLMGETVLVRVDPAEEVLPEEKVPDVDNGESVIVSDDPDKPFAMLVTMEDFAVALESLSRMRNQGGEP